MPRRDPSNEYPQHMFSWKIRKISAFFRWKKCPICCHELSCGCDYNYFEFLICNKKQTPVIFRIRKCFIQSLLSTSNTESKNERIATPTSRTNGQHQGKRCLWTCAKCLDSVSSCAFAKSHLGICSPLIHSIVSADTVSGQRRPWSTARMCRLIWGFTVRIHPKTHFRM